MNIIKYKNYFYNIGINMSNKFKKFSKKSNSSRSVDWMNCLSFREYNL